MKKLLFFILIIGIILISGCIEEEKSISEESETKPDLQKPTSVPTTYEPIEVGVPTFKIGSWNVYTLDFPWLSFRFSTSDDTTMELIGPDGISTDSVRYEIVQKPSEMIGETVKLKMAEKHVIPQVGTYKLLVKQNDKVVFTKDFTFQGFNLDVRWEPHYKYNEDGKLQMDYLDFFMKNDGDIPVYFDRGLVRFIAGGDKYLDLSGGGIYLNKREVDPKKEELIFTYSIFHKTLSTEDRDDLTIWLRDTSGQVYKYTTTVNPLEHIG